MVFFFIFFLHFFSDSVNPPPLILIQPVIVSNEPQRISVKVINTKAKSMALKKRLQLKNKGNCTVKVQKSLAWIRQLLYFLPL